MMTQETRLLDTLNINHCATLAKLLDLMSIYPNFEGPMIALRGTMELLNSQSLSKIITGL